MLTFAPRHAPLVALLTAALWLLPAATPRAGTASSLAALPPTMLWAWERHEDLRWLPSTVGVAYVAITLELTAGQVRLRPRAYRLLVRPETVVVPVVHVDASWRQPPALDAAQHEAIAAQVLKAARGARSRVVQLDFEVRRSQRGFLLALVGDLRRRLPADVALSVTALASWCAGDYWIGALEADEVVPMAFRMARDDGKIRGLLAEQGGFVRPRCRGALGMATDEAPVRVASARRYFFSPRSWDQDTWRRIQ
ncbi:hypothetical protein [Massilia glaciei]|uniref:DUF3142 domain-containing protein n=1 Tax=Massilia glaciei TaxID=1524097 RepID=A0A2U2I5P1_9BURK|nr:hypothetical protein [Massilia glaciei]PWF55076.1 hypothetical protein C7C56_003695 [Massilia glaciei]